MPQVFLPICPEILPPPLSVCGDRLSWNSVNQTGLELTEIHLIEGMHHHPTLKFKTGSLYIALLGLELIK